MNSSTREGVGRDRHRYLNGLTTSVADDISQLLMKNILIIHKKTWEEFLGDEETKMFLKNCKQAKKFRSGNVPPPLEHCETTFLASLIERFDTSSKKNESVEKLRSHIRNKAAHDVATPLSAEEYCDKVSLLIGEVESFQSWYPGINFEKIKKELEEKKVFKEDLPSHNIGLVPKLAGRNEEMRELQTLLKTSHVVLITGSAGIGKTSLAEKFAEVQIENPSIVCLSVSMKNFSKVIAKIDDETELKNEISSVIGKHIGQIRESVQETPNDAYVILQDYVHKIPKYAKLIFILDNIDGFDKQKTQKVLESVITGICSATGNINFICTSRNWSSDVDSFSNKVINLDPIKSRDDVSRWFRENTEHVEDNIIEEAVDAADGVPLLMTLLASRLASKNRKPIGAGDIPKIKQSKNYEARIDDVLDWSYDWLLQEDGLQLFMQCASIFPKFMNESALVSIFHKFGARQESSAETFIEQLAELSLIQYNSNNEKHYMHPYIQEYVQRKCSNQINEMKYIYFIVYYSKLMEITQDQLTRDRFDGAIETLFDDIENYQELLKVERRQFVESRI